MGHGKRAIKSFAVAFILIMLLVVAPALVMAAETDKVDNRPERGIAAYTDYSGVAVARGENVQMDLTLENKGRSDENIDVRITEAAKGWKATLKGARYRVNGMYVPGGKAKTLALNLEPEKGIGPGKYAFRFEAKTADGKFTSIHALNVTVEERKVVRTTSRSPPPTRFSGAKPIPSSSSLLRCRTRERPNAPSTSPRPARRNGKSTSNRHTSRSRSPVSG